MYGGFTACNAQLSMGYEPAPAAAPCRSVFDTTRWLAADALQAKPRWASVWRCS